MSGVALAAAVAAAVAVKEWLEASGQPGTLRFYGTPAEEGGAGKVYMVRGGLMDDVDAMLHWHAGDANSAAATGSSTESNNVGVVQDMHCPGWMRSPLTYLGFDPSEKRIYSGSTSMLA